MASTAQKAKDIVFTASLSPIEHFILTEDFINGAYDPNLAAEEVLRRIETCQDADVEDTLRSLKHDWHRLLELVTAPAEVPTAAARLLAQRHGDRCCITPESTMPVVEPVATFIVSPKTLELWEDDTNPPLRRLLEAFLTPARADLLRHMLADSSSRAELLNLLLVSPSIAHGLRCGHVQILPLPRRSWDYLDDVNLQETAEQMYYLMPLNSDVYEEVFFADGTRVLENRAARKFRLRTANSEEMPLPSQFLLKMQHKFARSRRRFAVEKLAREPLPLQSSSFWSRGAQLAFRRLWHIVPAFLRNMCYKYMLSRSRHVDISPLVYPLPFGLYAKMDACSDGNEPAALELLEKEAPSIPAPLLIDRFCDRDGKNWFIMTRLPGFRVDRVFYRMSYAERDQLAHDLSRTIDQMHAIPNKTPYLFAGVRGGPINDPSASASGCGPYNSEADFNAQISKGFQQSLLEQIPTAFSKTHKSVFTHSDLFFSNVLVDGGRLSGIIDWEYAGFLPEYWEFTKVMLAVRLEPHFQDIYRKIWGHKYDEELAVRTWLADVFPFGGPEE
ncbi:hypothetical protein VTK73DRAFT_5561 [Phialemonium thermophilum]|uniref:Aminoglycoside phosphotransferase domain-containing protein n=1 Tax=Phialemonium thermophilum TaxID=223376 RepID=A0ABR3XWZ7_9PEZI